MKGIAFAEKLLATLGETPIRNAEVVVFDQARNGFNLSVTADLLIRKGEKQFILLTKRLPEQFLNILKEAGTEVIPIGEKDQGRPLIEGVLHGLGIPVSFGHFSFRIPEEGKRPRLTASFSTLRVMNEGEPVYLIDFDMPPAFLPFLTRPPGRNMSSDTDKGLVLKTKAIALFSGGLDSILAFKVIAEQGIEVLGDHL